jgi:hypothetical protein
MKTIYGVNYDSLKVVSEEIIESAAEAFKDTDPENNFNKLLLSAKEFRIAGLTPIFLVDDTMQQVLVTTKEKLQRKYH